MDDDMATTDPFPVSEEKRLADAAEDNKYAPKFKVPSSQASRLLLPVAALAATLLAATGASDHLRNNCLVLLGLGLIDSLVLTPWLQGRIAAVKDLGAARWFFLHAIANACVCATALTSMRAVLTDPPHAVDGRVYADTSLFGDASVWPLTIINSVHVYHMLGGGFNLTSADYFHHLLFIPALGFPGQVLRWGALSNWLAFFISGFPGGVSYLLLGLSKIGVVESMLEKRVNANLNTWVRAPGIMMAVVLLYQALLLEQHVVPRWAAYVQLVLPLYNALYFNKQACANYAVHYMLHLLGQDALVKKHIEQRISCTTGEYVMAWKDAVAVPQRGS